ncbi:hypothetical protein [Helicobacter bizzozeronii]|uniref:hypothetical protein n=1 Tax=Helicobacter bizzozeronii TaxID=56877 RepID=UPI0013157EE7|nr:hypothetical protein [Helicobacter bizzozeronii]
MPLPFIVGGLLGLGANKSNDDAKMRKIIEDKVKKGDYIHVTTGLYNKGNK